MAGHSVFIDFWLEPGKLSSASDRELVMKNVLPLFEEFSDKLEKVCETQLPGGHFIMVYASQSTSLSGKIYKKGLVTLSLDYFVEEKDINECKILLDDGQRIERQLAEKLGSVRSKVLATLKHAPPLNPYFTTSDNRILEYDIIEKLFEEQSKFQKVGILKTKSFGNILFLDDLQNLAESDLAYTQGLMNFGVEKYRGAEVLILGGGDGALLYELLKENPKFVTMIDIDDTVMISCRKHLRSVCGDVLDNYAGSNYQIFVDDAIVVMEQMSKTGEKFDFVFADLTDVPLSSNTATEHWTFYKHILNSGVRLLKPQGKYMTHATGIQCESTLRMLETQIEALDTAVTYTRTSAFVPSFMEQWCFYQLSLKDGEVKLHCIQMTLIYGVELDWRSEIMLLFIKEIKRK